MDVEDRVRYTEIILKDYAHTKLKLVINPYKKNLMKMLVITISWEIM